MGVEAGAAFEHLIRQAETEGLQRFLAVLDDRAPVELSDPEGLGITTGKRLILRGAWEAGEDARCPLGWLGYQVNSRFPAAGTGAAVNAFTALWDAEGEGAISRWGMREAVATELARRLG